MCDGSKSFEQRLAALDNYLQEVQGEQTRLASGLAAKLDSAGIKELPIPKIPDLADLTSSQLEKLKGLLNRILNNRMPDSTNQDIESLQELDRIEKLISRIIDDLKDGRSLTDDSVESAANERWTPRVAEKPENQADDPNRPSPDHQISVRSQSAAGRADHPGSRKSERTGDDLQDGMGQPEGYSVSAGRARS